MRFTHYLKDNKTSGYPTDFIFFDTETTPNVLENGDIDQPFKLGVALYWRRREDQPSDTLEYFRFTNIARFWRFVGGHALPKRRLILVAHNLQFDFMVLGGFSYLRRMGFELTKLITNGRVNLFSYRRDKATILCLDNMNYFNTSLKSLGSSIGLAKLDMPEGAQSRKVWFTYCQRDVDIMHAAWKLWLAFLHDNDLGTFGNTLAGQAFNAYRHRFMTERILIKNNRPATELERSSYRGGRVECFQVGKLPQVDYYLLDINSMYPYCMKTYPYPKRQLYIRVDPSPEFLMKVLTTKNAIADVLVHVDQPTYSLKYNNRLITPVGTFRVTLTTQELTQAITRGHLIKIYRLSAYSRGYIFTDFVDWFYNQRLVFKQASNPSYAYLCKIMLNSLYGKFGQRNEEWEFIGVEPEMVDYVEIEIDAQTGKKYVVRCIAGQVSKTTGTVEGYNSFAAISAEVTANARMMLLSFIEKAGRENVYYCDTDSLLVNQAGYDNLAGDLHNTELGKLKLVKKARSITLHNVKDYVITGQAKIKGIPKTAKKIAEGEYITYQQQGIRAALHNKNTNAMTWKRVPKKVHRIYEKGVVTFDSQVTPLIMLHEFDENWLDYEAMVDRYGIFATYRGKWLESVMRGRQFNGAAAGDILGSYSPEDRHAAALDDLEARRAGQMVYQRRR